MVKSNQESVWQQTRGDCVKAILDSGGKISLATFAKEYKLSKQTIVTHLSNLQTSWQELKTNNSGQSDSQKLDQKSKLDTTIPSQKPDTKQGQIATNQFFSLDFLSPATQALISKAKDIPAWLAPTVMQQFEDHFRKKENLTWFRPGILNPKQNQIIDAMVDSHTQVVVVMGPRRTGKSTGGYIGVCENVVEGQRLHWGMWGATEHSACKILNDVWKDQITWEETHHLITNKTFKRITFKNGGSLEVNPTTVSGSKGMAYQGIWLTEFDQILKDNPDAVASIVGILRSEPQLKLLLDMNMGSGAYFRI